LQTACELAGVSMLRTGGHVRTVEESDLRRRAREWVERTTADQDVRVELTDPAAIDLIVSILWPRYVDDVCQT
jgi:hypothetical protein